jgi:GNAT superfamily N-acetyltransferase
MMEPTFKLADQNDLDILLDLVREYYAFDGHHYDRDAVRAALVGLMRKPAFGRVWLICDGATPAGYVVLTIGYSIEYHGHDAFVDELYLREGYRGRGWGRGALAFVEQACRELGIHALHLEVERDNAAAHAVYRTFGFTDHDRYLLTKRVVIGHGQGDQS